jgi:hypothetical protein
MIRSQPDSAACRENRLLATNLIVQRGLLTDKPQSPTCATSAPSRRGATSQPGADDNAAAGLHRQPHHRGRPSNRDLNQGAPERPQGSTTPSSAGRTSTCRLSLPRFARGRPRASRRLRRRSALAESHPWGIPIEKFNALKLKRSAHLIASRSKPTDGLGAAGLHVPNCVVADSDHFSQSLLIKSKQRSRCSQLVSREIHSNSSLLVLHQKLIFGITPKLGAERRPTTLYHMPSPALEGK